MSQNFHGDWAIPKQWDLPGIRRIRTKLIAGGPFDGNFVYSTQEDKAGVFIDKRLPIEVQRYTYLHELHHATHELIDIMLEKFPAYVMTKSMYKMNHPDWLEPGDEEEEAACSATPDPSAPTQPTPQSS